MEELSEEQLLRLMVDLDAGSNLFGPLDEEVRSRLFAVADNPSEQNWECAHGIILRTGGMMTLWQALLEYTDYDVVRGPSTDQDGKSVSGWSRLPTRQQILVALSSVGPL